MTLLKKMGSFRSYVGLEEYEMKNPSTAEGSVSRQPNFLNGELIISEASNVLKFASLSKKNGLPGSLFVTNARVVFVASDNSSSEESLPLLSINTLWYYENSRISTGGKKHRKAIKLGSNSISNPSLIPSGSTRVHELLIVCSNFRTARYSFKFSSLDHGLRICNAIIHHAFPLQLERLFYFDYSKVTTTDWRKERNYTGANVPSFLEKGDWLKEINITRSTVGFRISSINEGFQLCGSLPEWIVVPADLNDARVGSLAQKLKGSRPPFWCWSNSSGAAVLRMSKLNNESESSAENAFFELLRKTHSHKLQPEIIDLDKDFSSKDMRQSLNRLVELCCPESFSQYTETDSRFYSMLDQTKWFQWISKTLSLAQSAANAIVKDGKVIVLQEQESRDLSCLCSSVIQIVVDARFRTTTGFFSLIQKEWIAFGHPFHSSYMHTSPIFLLFLDTVHQLMKQNPVEFEFNDSLLIRIWDMCFDPTCGTFIFDTPQERKTMDRWNSYSHSAWSTIIVRDAESQPATPTDQQFVSVTVQAKLLSVPVTSLPRNLMNPMFKLKSLLYPPAVGSYTGSLTLHSSSCICDLHLWEDIYLCRPTELMYPTVIAREIVRVSSPIKVSGNSPNKLVVTSASPGSKDASTFLYPTQYGLKPSHYTRRDPTVELKVVDLLLAALSSSTRYNRNAVIPSTSNSKLIKRNSPSGGNNTDGRLRRNPFLNS